MAANSESSQARDNCCYVVTFNLLTEKDEDGSAELLVRARNHWLFISVDPADLKNNKEASSPLLRNFEQLRDAAIAQKKRSEAELIGKAHDEAQGEDAQEPSPKRRQVEYTNDSGYCSDQDQSKDHEAKSDVSKAEAEDDAEETLQNWMLAPLAKQFTELKKSAKGRDKDKDKPQTLAAWYEVPVLFYALQSTKNDLSQLEAVERTDLDEKKFRERNLQNALTLPKKLRNAAPWHNPLDIVVLHETEDIHMSIHPTLVCLKPNDCMSHEASPRKPTHFLKLVPSGPGSRHSVEREISFLKKLQDLRSKKPEAVEALRFPALQGLVAPPTTKGSHATILGFLLELIPDPQPLTHKLDESIPQAKRDTWADQTKEMVECLHKNGITWGDAKADNFLVDKHDKLWIIDFGGGFTEGWIKEENLETRKGDREGVEKIQNAVRDPVNGTQELDEVLSGGREADEAGEGAASQSSNNEGNNKAVGQDQSSRKRKR